MESFTAIQNRRDWDQAPFFYQVFSDDVVNLPCIGSIATSSLCFSCGTSVSRRSLSRRVVNLANGSGRIHATFANENAFCERFVACLRNITGRLFVCPTLTGFRRDCTNTRLHPDVSIDPLGSVAVHRARCAGCGGTRRAFAAADGDAVYAEGRTAGGDNRRVARAGVPDVRMRYRRRHAAIAPQGRSAIVLHHVYARWPDREPRRAAEYLCGVRPPQNWLGYGDSAGGNGVRRRDDHRVDRECVLPQTRHETAHPACGSAIFDPANGGGRRGKTRRQTEAVDEAFGEYLFDRAP